MANKPIGNRVTETPVKRRRGRPNKEIYINVSEFIGMVRFIKDHPVDRQNTGLRDDDVPIPDTGKLYWNHAMSQILECLKYIKDKTPMTSSKLVMHENKLNYYKSGDSRIDIYEYIRKEIIEANGGSKKIHKKETKYEK